jgi:predicted branched-subunit amino acid permease
VLTTTDPRTSTPDPARRAARRGVLAMLPLVGAYAPFALVIGSAIADHGARLAGWVGGWLIFGGSAQLAALRTLDTAGPFAAIVAGILIHARLLVYSAGLARSWPEQPRWFRIVAAGLIIDPTFAAAQAHAHECTDPVQQRRFFLAAGLTLGAGWSAAMALGTLIGSRLDGLDIQIVVPLCLLALVGDGLRVRSSRLVVLVAAAVAVLAAAMPVGTGLLAAVVAGTIVGVLAEARPS